MDIKELIEQNRVEAKTITIVVRGQEFKAKLPRGAGDILVIGKRAKELAEAVEGGAPTEWQPFLPLPKDVLKLVGQMKAVLIEPKPTTVELLEIAATCGPLILELSQAYDIAVGVEYGVINSEQAKDITDTSGMLEAAACKEVEDLKNASEATASEEA